jgi:hypothetical protein
MNEKLRANKTCAIQILEERIFLEKEDAVSLGEELAARKKEFANTTKQQLEKPITRAGILGTYHLVGKNSAEDKSSYVGLLSLHLEEGQIRATWLLEEIDVHYGYGFLHERLLVLNFMYASEGQEYKGVVAYEFLTNEIITGTWTEETNTAIGMEFGRKLPLEKIDSLQFFGKN